MGRAIRLVAVAATLSLALASCGETKDTGFNNLPKGPGGSKDGGAKLILLKAGNVFSPVTFAAKVGEKVTWRNDDGSGQPHNVVADDGSFDSNPQCGADQTKCMPNGGTFSSTFGKAGKYGYYCVVHGAKGGAGMAGTVDVA